MLKFNLIFFGIVLVVYIVLWALNPSWWVQVGSYFLKTFLNKILPLLVMVYFLMFVLSFVWDNKLVKKWLAEWKYWHKLIFSALWGVIVSGPLYVWYDFLKELKNKWLTNGHIAAFIWARGIKLPFLAMMIGFFGLNFTLIYNLVLLVFAFLVGLVVDFF